MKLEGFLVSNRDKDVDIFIEFRWTYKAIGEDGNSREKTKSAYLELWDTDDPDQLAERLHEFADRLGVINEIDRVTEEITREEAEEAANKSLRKLYNKIPGYRPASN